MFSDEFTLPNGGGAREGCATMGVLSVATTVFTLGR